MLPSKSQNIISIAVRYVSRNSTRQSTAVAVEAKDTYYQKIANQAYQDESSVKPEGWDEAKPFEAIPGIGKGLPLIGNVWKFMPFVGEYYNVQLLDLHRQLQAKYGNLTYFGGIPAQRPMLFTYDPDDIEKVLRNEGPWPVRYGLPSLVYYRTKVRKDIFQGVGGVLTMQGEEWFHFRSIVNKILMQPRTAEMYVESMDNVADNLVDNIRYFSKQNPKHEMSEDFQNELYKWGLESIAVIAYNKRIGCLERDADKNALGQRTNQKFIEECLENADPDLTIPDHKRSVLERLSKQDKKIATAMVTDMLIAGVDTTGRTMGNALYFLSKNPEKQEALRNELKKYMPNKNSPVTKEMLRESPYLKAVIKETTRIAPIAVGLLRTTVKDMVLSGYQVPKGTDVIGASIIPSLDDKFFIQANEFIPERWLRTTIDKYSYKNVNPFVSLPFGFGPRSCVGKRLANLELEVGLSKVIRNFKISWHRPDPTFGTKFLYGILDPLRLTIEELDNA